MSSLYSDPYSIAGTALYGLTGKPLCHSRSPELINAFFAESGIDAHYSLYPLDDISELMPLLHGTRSIRGLNVTIPYKEKVMPLLASLTPEAQKTGAVNCIAVERRKGDIMLHGHNTDMQAFREALERVMPDTLKSLVSDNSISNSTEKSKSAYIPVKALILGTGGASKAVKAALGQMGIEAALVSRSAKGDNIISYTDLCADIIAGSRIIVNATPLGTLPDTGGYPPIDYRAIMPGTVAFDLVYNPPITRFMSLCRSQGAIVSNGYEMLRLQAVASLKFWGY